jgi:thiamine biosynthesis lipoprotein
MYSFKFPAIGTQWQIDFPNNTSKDKLPELERKIHKRIEEFDLEYSRFRKDSWVTKNSKQAGKVTIPNDLFPMLELYEEVYGLSEGLVTPMIGRTLEEAGYDADYSLVPKTLTHPPKFHNAIEFNKETITFKEHVLLDFGACGKGYLADIVALIIEKNGIAEYCIDASGDILQKGPEVLRVGLEHPDDPTLAIGVANVKNRSICGSSGSRRKWDRFHHTINPHTLTSPTEIKAVWTIADTCMLADILSTALFLDPQPDLYKDFNFEYVLLYKDNTAEKSKDFPGELFTS